MKVRLVSTKVGQRVVKQGMVNLIRYYLSQLLLLLLILLCSFIESFKKEEKQQTLG